MLHVSVESLLAFAQGLEGQELRTVVRGCRFRLAKVEIGGRRLLFVTSQGKDQQAGGKYLQETCEAFSQTNSYRPSDYTHTHGVTYTLALIRRFAESQAATA